MKSWMKGRGGEGSRRTGGERRGGEGEGVVCTVQKCPIYKRFDFCGLQSVEADCDDRIIFEDYCRFIRKENGFLLYIFPSQTWGDFPDKGFPLDQL
jgi:hypothetical protein